MSQQGPGRSAPPSLLTPRRQSLAGYVALSLFGHGFTVAALLIVGLVARGCAPAAPVVDLDRSIEVSMVVLPKSRTKMPDRAARTPVPKGTPSPEPPAPEPPPTPPVKQSDLVIHKEQPEPKPVGISDDERRAQLMAEMERQRLLDDLLNAPVGPVDRDASDPNATGTESINALGTASRGDPEFARYVAQVQQIFMKHFRPLAAITQANPNLVTQVSIKVDPGSGRILGWEIAEPSGVPAFDAAAERAVTAVPSIPLPPPKYLPLVAEGYVVNFRSP